MAKMTAAQDAHDTAVLRRQLLLGARDVEERKRPPATFSTDHVDQDVHLPQQSEAVVLV